MKRLLVAMLLVAMIYTAWHFYSRMLETRYARRFARKRARDAIAWQKVLDKNAADRATDATKTGPV